MPGESEGQQCFARMEILPNTASKRWEPLEAITGAQSPDAFLSSQITSLNRQRTIQSENTDTSNLLFSLSTSQRTHYPFCGCFSLKAQCCTCNKAFMI